MTPVSILCFGEPQIREIMTHHYLIVNNINDISLYVYTLN